uniref:RING-type domain-containing protein n=1 Tax=Malurus cyaneus samueli TaxID=2593467 RepID=A0A8C5U5M3_9PASS
AYLKEIRVESWKRVAVLTCPICLSLYQDPVSLRCGHNFCRGLLNLGFCCPGGWWNPHPHPWRCPGKD